MGRTTSLVFLAFIVHPTIAYGGGGGASPSSPCRESESRVLSSCMTAEARAAQAKPAAQPDSWARRVALIVTQYTFEQNPHSDLRCSQAGVSLLDVRALANAWPLWLVGEGRWTVAGFAYSPMAYLSVPADGKLVLDGFSPSAPNSSTRMEGLAGIIALDGSESSYRLTGRYGVLTDKASLSNPTYDEYTIDAHMDCAWAKGLVP